jgi:hypothetical protein
MRPAGWDKTYMKAMLNQLIECDRELIYFARAARSVVAREQDRPCQRRPTRGLLVVQVGLCGLTPGPLLPRGISKLSSGSSI